MNKLQAIFAITLCLLLSVPAAAQIYIEDFESYPFTGLCETDETILSDGLFQHVIQDKPFPEPPGDSLCWAINQALPNDKALWLYPGIDEITFDLSGVEYVDYVSIDFIDYLGLTRVDIIGTLGTYSSFADSPGVWDSVDTTGQTLGEITMIKLISNEAAFDNITINVVPEPATFALFALAAVFIRKKP